MKRVHIIGAGGPAGIGMARCLRGYYEVTGEDIGEFSSLAMECPGWGSVTEGSSADPLLLPEMVISVPDSRVLASDFKPDILQVELCQDKARTARILGAMAPKTYWMRDTHGAGGQGAQMLTGYLPGRNYSQEFVFHNGVKLAQFQKERVSYSLKRRTEGLENVGSSAVSVCTGRPDVLDTALQALYCIAEYTATPLHGFYGVDLKEDETACPKVTEINAGRLLTASYSHFWLTGYNLPLVGVRAFLEEEAPVLPEYPLGYGVLRQTDQLPRLVEPSVTRSWTQ